MKQQPGEGSAELALTGCGPFDRGLALAGLSSDESPQLPLRAIIPALVAWVPLFLHSLIVPTPETPGSISFLHDLTGHVRFLLVVPTLVFIERSIGRRTRTVASAFLTSGLVDPEDEPRFRSALRNAKRLLGSVIPEATIAVVSFVILWLAMRTRLEEPFLLWFESGGPGGGQISPAGWWYLFWSSYALFLFLRWVWRYIVWCGFLRSMSRLPLRVVGTHPDKAGGLGFVTLGHGSFAMLSFAASCIVAAGVGTEILNEGTPLASFRSGLIGFLVVAVLVGVAPLLVFLGLLVRAKHYGLLQYGEFALRYVQDFHRKWCEGKRDPSEQALGSSDIQSLADVGGSFERLESMRVVLIDARTAGMFAITTAGPMLPLLLTVMPLKEIVQVLLKAVL